MEKIYLSGPISDIQEEALINFSRAEKNLTQMGYEVINPFSIVPKKEDWESDKEYWFRCMIACLPHMKGVNKICKVHYEITEKPIRSFGLEIESLFMEKMEMAEIFEIPEPTIEDKVITIRYLYISFEKNNPKFLESVNQ